MKFATHLVYKHTINGKAKEGKNMRGILPATMKALVAYGPNNYRLETDWPAPICGSRDIVIRTEGCGICSSDLKCLHGAASYWGNEKQPAWVDAPFIPGHEFLGHIVAIGDEVDGYELGERITCDQIAPCGTCRFCRDGKYWMCQPHRMYGYFKEYCGGMAEYVRIQTEHAMITKVPKELRFESAVLIEPFGCAKHAVDRASITNKDIVVIAGAGTLGLGMITYAHTLHPKMLISLDMVDSRLKKAREFGADLAMNPGRDDVVDEIMELTDGYGCDIYIEATGHPSSVVQGMQMIRKLGTFVEFSVFGEPTTLDWSIIGDKKELNVLGSHLSPYTYPYVLEHMADGTLKTEGVVTKVFPLEQWQEAFSYAAGQQGDIKVAFRF